MLRAWAISVIDAVLSGDAWPKGMARRTKVMIFFQGFFCFVFTGSLLILLALFWWPLFLYSARYWVGG